MARKSHLRLIRDGYRTESDAPVPTTPVHDLENEHVCAECGSKIPAGLVHFHAPSTELRYCTQACARRVSAGVRLAATKRAKFASGEVPQTVRLSTLLAKLRRQGNTAAATAIERLHASIGNRCPKHGPMPDPVVGLLLAPISTPHGETKVAFACPHCSSPQVLEAWTKEGNLS